MTDEASPQMFVMTPEEIEAELIPLIEAAVIAKATLVSFCEAKELHSQAKKRRNDPIEMFLCTRAKYLMQMLEVQAGA